MILAEVGYMQDEHESAVEAIRKQRPNIQDAIYYLTNAYCSLYASINQPEDINCGLCHDFAEDLSAILSHRYVVEPIWGDALFAEETNCDCETNDCEKCGRFSGHCVVRINERFYDSEHPYGVDDWKTMPIFKEEDT